MNYNRLLELYKNNSKKTSDKWTIYLHIYNEIITPYEKNDISILEIGIQNGGGLQIWADYFKNAKYIVGCDIDVNCGHLQFDDERIHVVIGDINTQNTKDYIIEEYKNFDIIIDDGSHRSSDIIATFCKYFPTLNDGGLFIIEDLHCSYWDNYEGGLFDPKSSIQFLKMLIDVVNFEHWGLSLKRSQYLAPFLNSCDLTITDEVLSHIHSIQFINSLCIIKKATPSDNELGERIVSGKEAAVNKKILDVDHMKSIAPDQSGNKYNKI